LIEELVELGHDATLFASGDSVTRAKLVPACPRALKLDRPRSDPIAAQAVLLETMAKHAGEFDVIHAHTEWLHLPLLKPAWGAVRHDIAWPAGFSRFAGRDTAISCRPLHFDI
jgi:hypothetical protein